MKNPCNFPHPPDIFRKQSMEKQLEELLAKPEWQEHFLNMLVEHLEQPIKINEPAKISEYIPMGVKALSLMDISNFQDVIKYFSQQPDKFYDILKKHIKTAPKETDKPIFDSFIHPWVTGKFSEQDVVWNSIENKQKASEIPTKHLFYCIRLCYNKTCPREYRVDYEGSDLTFDSRPEVRHTLKCMFYQIGLRDDLTEEQLDKLTLMAKNVRLYL